MSSQRARPSRLLACRRLSLRSASRRFSVSAARRSSTERTLTSSCSRSLASEPTPAPVGAVDGRRREPDGDLRMLPCAGESEPNAAVAGTAGSDGVWIDQLEADALDDTLPRDSDDTSGGGVGRGGGGCAGSGGMGDDGAAEEIDGAVDCVDDRLGPNVPEALVADRASEPSSSDSPPTMLESGSTDALRRRLPSVLGEALSASLPVARRTAGEGGTLVLLSTDRVDLPVDVRSRDISSSDRTALMLVCAPTVRLDTRRPSTSSPWSSRSTRWPSISSVMAS